jgi:DNA-directed RNA polymerase sigma subunit (sigma70/sigma32)
MGGSQRQGEIPYVSITRERVHQIEAKALAKMRASRHQAA